MTAKSRKRTHQAEVDRIIAEHRARGATLADTAKALAAAGLPLGRSRISERARALGLGRDQQTGSRKREPEPKTAADRLDDVVVELEAAAARIWEAVRVLEEGLGADL